MTLIFLLLILSIPVALVGLLVYLIINRVERDGREPFERRRN